MAKKSTGKNSINKRLDMYRERMQEIVSRLDVVESLLRGDTSIPYRPAVVESVYLQFRNVLELIATASLVIRAPLKIRGALIYKDRKNLTSKCSIFANQTTQIG